MPPRWPACSAAPSGPLLLSACNVSPSLQARAIFRDLTLAYEVGMAYLKAQELLRDALSAERQELVSDRSFAIGGRFVLVLHLDTRKIETRPMPNYTVRLGAAEFLDKGRSCL